jgi:hypothetical protein
VACRGAASCRFREWVSDLFAAAFLRVALLSSEGALLRVGLALEVAVVGQVVGLAILDLEHVQLGCCLQVVQPLVEDLLAVEAELLDHDVAHGDDRSGVEEVVLVEVGVHGEGLSLRRNHPRQNRALWVW